MTARLGCHVNSRIEIRLEHEGSLGRDGLAARHLPLGGVTMTNDNPALQSAVRKATIRLLPFLGLMLILNFLDRSNVGFAKVA